MNHVKAVAFESQEYWATSDQGHREPQLGPKKKTFSRGPFEEKLDFLPFKTAHSDVLYIFERRRGPKHHGAGVTYPLLPLPLSRRACQ